MAANVSGLTFWRDENVLKLIVVTSELCIVSGCILSYVNYSSVKLLYIKKHESHSEKTIPFSILF